MFEVGRVRTWLGLPDHCLPAGALAGWQPQNFVYVVFAILFVYLLTF